MNIGFDISDLCTARADGTTRYTREIASVLPTLNGEHLWEYFAPCTTPQLSNHPDTVRIRTSPWPKFWTQSRLPLDLFRYRPDVLFMPIQQLPIIRPPRMKTVAVVHDLAFHYFPQQTAYKDWLLLHVFTAQAVREADRIVAVSQATADDIAHEYGRTEDVHVIPHGINTRVFQEANTDKVSSRHDDLLDAYPMLARPYVLFVGQIQPRKNIGRLVDAFEKLREEHAELQLVIAGGHGWLQDEVIRHVNDSSVREHIHMIGRVPDDLLAPLYRRAEVFALVSLYEGFGMPILEAMASGCPVVTSTTSSMPEVAGGAGVLVDPFDSGDIARGLAEAIDRRDELQKNGLARASEFSWDETARTLLPVLTEWG